MNSFPKTNEIFNKSQSLSRHLYFTFTVISTSPHPQSYPCFKFFIFSFLMKVHNNTMRKWNIYVFPTQRLTHVLALKQALAEHRVNVFLQSRIHSRIEQSLFSVSFAVRIKLFINLRHSTSGNGPTVPDKPNGKVQNAACPRRVLELLCRTLMMRKKINGLVQETDYRIAPLNCVH